MRALSRIKNQSHTIFRWESTFAYVFVKFAQKTMRFLRERRNLRSISMLRYAKIIKFSHWCLLWTIYFEVNMIRRWFLVLWIGFDLRFIDEIVWKNGGGNEGASFESKIDVLQSRPSAGGHKILNFTSKILDFLTTGYLPFYDFFYVFSRA